MATIGLTPAHIAQPWEVSERLKTRAVLSFWKIFDEKTWWNDVDGMNGNKIATQLYMWDKWFYDGWSVINENCNGTEAIAPIRRTGERQRKAKLLYSCTLLHGFIYIYIYLYNVHLGGSWASSSHQDLVLCPMHYREICLRLVCQATPAISALMSYPNVEDYEWRTRLSLLPSLICSITCKQIISKDKWNYIIIKQICMWEMLIQSHVRWRAVFISERFSSSATFND
jgi:hypothetical protein